MKILITGGAGYIGTELTHLLAENPLVSEIVIYDNLSRKNYSLFMANRIYGAANIRFVKGDILNSRLLNKALKEVDVVYHLAAKVSTPFANEDPHSLEQVNHWGTAELSYAIEQSQAKKVFYLSSTSVYGPSTEKADELTLPNPQTYYGTSKYNGEMMLNRLRDSVELYVLRCGNVYGYSPSMRFDAVINRFMFEAHYNNRITIHGTGRQHRPFIHIKSVANVLNDLLNSTIDGGTYNLVGKNLSVLEIGGLLKEIYTEMETIYIQQDIMLRNLEVDTQTLLKARGLLHDRDIAKDLLEFKEHFAFNPLVGVSA